MVLVRKQSGYGQGQIEPERLGKVNARTQKEDGTRQKCRCMLMVEVYREKGGNVMSKQHNMLQISEESE